jgi:dipeptidyl-peptidase 4
MWMLLGRRRSALMVAVSLAGLTVAALLGARSEAQRRRYTTADYARAEQLMDYNLAGVVYHTVEHATWLPDGRFWYRDTGAGGATFLLIDPAKGTKGPAFDNAKLAAALDTLALPGVTAKFDAAHLPITELTPVNGDKAWILSLNLPIGARSVRCQLAGDGPGKCSVVKRGDGLRPGAQYALSPDGKRAAFLRDNNLWVREVAGGKETQLTSDGQPDYGYATDNAGWVRSDRPILVWSPDSKKIATFQQDQRKVGRMGLVSTNDGHPVIETWRYPLAGDAVVATIERVIVDVDAHTVVRLKMPPDQHRSSLCDDITCKGEGSWDDVQWSADSAQLAFVSTARDHKQEWLRIADVATGDVREAMNETVRTFFESGNGTVNWRYLSRSNEVLWFSERDNWGQMYLYDATTGSLKNQITRGEGNVTEVLRVDEKARTIYFLGVGKEAGRDPYFAALYRANFDGTGMQLLTPTDADHVVKMSPDGRYFLDVASTPVVPQTAAIRDADGKVAVELESQDITKLRAIGWVPPVPITVKARDGKTDLYGLMFKPTNFDATKKYPIVNHVYPGPQEGSCGTSRAFTPAHRDMQSLAELGFVVVCIDGMGTAGRSKSFHEALYGDLADNTIPDQIAGMKELAARYPWINLSRAGIYGHSGGGAATAAAMFHFPDFFKVGISESGNHDNREYEDDWAEKWAGLLVTQPDGTSNYDSQANQNFAKNLKGHLLLMHGTLDENVPPNNTLLVVDALIKANKDFDLIMIPNVGHGYGVANPYATRRRWDYFVRHLAGGTPPAEYEMKSWAEQQALRGN